MVDRLVLPEPGSREAVDFVERHLSHLASDAVAASPRFRGGQRAADGALAGWDVTGYARRRNEVHPPGRRGASALSPYIRHGLLPLRRVWDHVAGGPSGDVRKFRDELLWQEYARHWYARLGGATRHGVRHELAGRPGGDWDRSMACLDLVVGELECDGWLVNQTRMWLASDWAVRHGRRWQDGEDAFFRHLLDGSRAANRLGWQWTTGVGSSKSYGFSRWQVERRSPGVCSGCALRTACPIEDWPDEPQLDPTVRPDGVRGGVSPWAGPAEVVDDGRPVEAVWLTAESLGDADPALLAHPGVPAVFVFDEPLLARLRLASKRLVFLVETIAELATRRPVECHLGVPDDVLAGRAVAVTHAPVPGFARHAAAVAPAVTHPWPWLCPPSTGGVASFTAWRKGVREPRRSRA